MRSGSLELAAGRGTRAEQPIHMLKPF